MTEQQKIIEVIADILTLSAGDLDMQASIQDDLGLNPVEKADLLNSLAHRFNIVFEPGEIEELRTVNDLVILIEDKLLEWWVKN